MVPLILGRIKMLFDIDHWPAVGRPNVEPQSRSQQAAAVRRRVFARF
jgi:hypothetical protein